MQSEPIWNYVWLGTALRFLQDQEAEWPIHGPGWLLSNLDELERGLEQYGFVVSARALRNKFAELRTRLGVEPEAYRLTEADKTEVSTAARSLRDTIAAEGEGKVAFVVSERRYDSARLLNDVGSLLPAGIFAGLDETARFDLSEAGRALAFELPTAAAFHLLRATEQVLRHFYEDWVRQQRVWPRLWGPMTQHLRARSRRPPEGVLNHLDHIRLNFRNPTNHPEKIYDIEEAQDLFALCCDAISQMDRNRRG